MIYLKSFLAGLATLIVVTILYVAISFGLLFLKIWREEGGLSVGSVGFYVSSWPTLAIASLVFAAGFYWQYRRARKQLQKA